MKINIALSGKSGSGKTTIAKYLIDKYGYCLCNTGKAPRQICNMLFHSESKTLLNKITDTIKKIDSYVWIKKAFSEIDDSKPIVFDSVRFLDDYNYLKSKKFLLVRIECSRELIVDRLNKRGQIIDIENDFIHNAETELDDIVFDYTIINDGSLLSFYMKIDSILKMLSR